MSHWVRELWVAVILACVGAVGVAAASDMPQEYKAVTITKNLNVLLPNFFTYSTDTIPASADGCPITSATWYIHMNTVGANGVLWSSDYKPWSQFEAAAAQPGNAGLFTILENSLTKKIFRQPKAWETTGINSSVYYDHAKVEAVYTCAKASPPPTPPEPTCEKIWWCKDDDGDGYGNCDYPAHECTKPAGFAECPGVADGGYCDCEEGNPNVQDTALYYTDADGDGYVAPGSKAWLCPKQVTAQHVAMTKEQAQAKIDCDDNAKWITTANVCTDSDGDGWWVTPCTCGKTSNKQVALTAENQTKQDCNDKNKAVTVPQTFYWDGDGDGYPVKGSAKTECAVGLYNTNGKWITLVQAKETSGGGSYKQPVYEPTECDNDPNGQALKVYYLDADGDGKPFPAGATLYDPPVVPYVGPVGSAVTPGSTVTPPSVTSGSAIPLLSTGVSGAGAPKPATAPSTAAPPAKNGKYEAKQFCSDAKAKQAKFVRATAMAADWDWCDANSKLFKPKTYCLDQDADTFGGKKSLHCKTEPPNAGYVNATETLACTDCDDTDDDIGDFFQIFRDADEDGFGDIRLSNKVACKETVPDTQKSAYQQGGSQYGKGWVLEPNDLSDIIDADHDMVKNLTETAQRYFLVEQENGELLFCRHADGVGVGHVACFTADTIPILHTFCPRTVENLPLIRLSDLTTIAVGAADFGLHRGLTKSCLAVALATAGDPPALIFQSPQIKIVFTDFDPIGRHLLPLAGSPFAGLGFLIDPPAGLESLTIADSLMQRLLPFVVTDVAAMVHGPVPVRFVGDDATRSILMNGEMGPIFKFAAQDAGAGGKGIPDLLTHPWIVLKTAAATNLSQFADTDMDYLPDGVELLFHLDPQSKDTDGDGYEDALEYMRAHQDAELALAPGVGVQDWAAPNVLTSDEQTVFDQAKSDAIGLVPATLERLMELYEGDSDVAINADIQLMTLLIADARTAFLWSNFSPEWTWLAPFAPVRGDLFGWSNDCGEDKKSLCIDFVEHLEYQGQALINALTDTLLHEALHRVLKMQIPDKSHAIEHDIIYDVLGDGDVGFCLGDTP